MADQTIEQEQEQVPVQGQGQPENSRKFADLSKLPEMPVSVNFYAVDQDGFNYQWTLRDINEIGLLKRVNAFKALLLSNGVVPKQVGQQPQGQAQQGQAADNSPRPPMKGETSERAAMVTPPGANGNKNALSFQADNMVGSITEGQQYWKVKGGKFSKYGVTVWPEVLEAAGFDVDALNIGQRYSLQGFTAYYVLNSEGKPHKVTELVRS